MSILEEAEKEVNEEFRRQAIEAEKIKIREKRKGKWYRFVNALKTKKLVIRLENRNV